MSGDFCIIMDMNKITTIIFIAVLLLFFAISCSKKNSKIEVIDNSIGGSAPCLTLNGPDSIALPLGDTFVDPGAYATNFKGEAITVYNNTNLNPNMLGDYYVNYIATDAYGAQVTKTRKVSVVIATSHWLGDWDVDHNCKTITQLNLLNNEANITAWSNILTITHDNVNITGRTNGANITIQPFVVSTLAVNVYSFTGVGVMASDAKSFTVNYTYTGISGLAGNGNCTATYRPK